MRFRFNFSWLNASSCIMTSIGSNQSSKNPEELSAGGCKSRLRGNRSHGLVSLTRNIPPKGHSAKEIDVPRLEEMAYEQIDLAGVTLTSLSITEVSMASRAISRSFCAAMSANGATCRTTRAALTVNPMESSF